MNTIDILRPVIKPTCDRCNAPATVEEIDGSHYCARHAVEEMRLRGGEKPDAFGLYHDRIHIEKPGKMIAVVPIKRDSA